MPIAETPAVLTASERRRFLDVALGDSLVFERLITAIYSNVLREGDVAVDGGACEGLHTIPLAKAVGPTGRVLAVEAVPRLAQRLIAATTASPQVRVIQRALYRETTALDFHYIVNDRWRSALKVDATPETEVETIRVETMTLDELLEASPGWRFGKFDLEGGEYDAFLGGSAAIRRLQPFLAFEWTYHAPERYGYEPRQFGDLIASFAYRAYDMFGQPILVDQWHDPSRGWYAMAVPSGSRDDAFVRDVYPTILRSIWAAEVSA